MSNSSLACWLVVLTLMSLMLVDSLRSCMPRTVDMLQLFDG
jgi:hypothetical protein